MTFELAQIVTVFSDWPLYSQMLKIIPHLLWIKYKTGKTGYDTMFFSLNVIKTFINLAEILFRVNAMNCVKFPKVHWIFAFINDNWNRLGSRLCPLSYSNYLKERPINETEKKERRKIEMKEKGRKRRKKKVGNFHIHKIKCLSFNVISLVFPYKNGPSFHQIS